jgi:anti-sigma factor RsiW
MTMKWQCALLQRWLPDYPDGELPAWRKRWLESHVGRCAACRQELAVYQEMVASLKTAPLAEPDGEFWGEFSREMHLKLVQAASETPPAPALPRSRPFRLPYLAGASALAIMLVWVAVHLTGPGTPVQNVARVKPKEVTQMAAVPARTSMPAPETGAAASVMEQYVPVSLEAGAALPEDDVDISGWDLDSELAGMTSQEREIFLHKLDQRQKDGSCIRGSLPSSWG